MEAYSPDYLVKQLAGLVNLLAELKSDLNALRADFRAHDHGDVGAYAGLTIRINASPNVFSGEPETNSTVVTPVPNLAIFESALSGA